MRADEIRAALGAACTAADRYIADNHLNGRFCKHYFGAYNTPERDKLYGTQRGELKLKVAEIEFNLSGVSTKWGFGEGDCLDPIYHKWVDSRGWRSSNGQENLGYPYVQAHKLLWEIWERFLLPVSGLEAGVVSMWDTVHNPIRCDGEYTGVGESVTVSSAEIIKIADEIFPARSGAWLNLYNQFTLSTVRTSLGDPAAIYFADTFEPAFKKVTPEVEEVFLALLQNGVGREFVSFTQALDITVGALDSGVATLVI